MMMMMVMMMMMFFKKISKWPDLDVDGSNERCFAVEVPGIDDIILAGIKDELGQVDFASVDRIEQS